MNLFVGPKIQQRVVITHEDIDRAHDRARVQDARSHHSPFSRVRLMWLLVGPGILVMLGENDGPSMLSYAATGAKFGIGFFLPFIVLTFVMAIVVQEMTVRLGAATQRGHAELIFERFGPYWGWFSMVDLGIGNFPDIDRGIYRHTSWPGLFWCATLGLRTLRALALVYGPDVAPLLDLGTNHPRHCPLQPCLHTRCAIVETRLAFR